MLNHVYLFTNTQLPVYNYTSGSKNKQVGQVEQWSNTVLLTKMTTDKQNNQRTTYLNYREKSITSSE